jgi:Leucine-rich repeat (LRR) protein
VTESLLLRLTECDSLQEIRVISLRNQQLTGCLKTLAKCENLTIAYLQGNFIQEKDLMHLQSFSNLKKIDLSDNSITSLPPAKVFTGLSQLKFLYLHNNNISNWSDLQALVGIP